MYLPFASTVVSLVLLLSRFSLVTATSDIVTLIHSAERINADSHMTSIRGLLDTDLEKRQRYICYAPKTYCETIYCCQNSSWSCCRDGSCCPPGYYCVIDSVGTIGCCPDGKLCYGLVDPPVTVGHPTATTSTSYIQVPTTVTSTQPLQSTFTPNPYSTIPQPYPTIPQPYPTIPQPYPTVPQPYPTGTSVVDDPSLPSLTFNTPTLTYSTHKFTTSATNLSTGGPLSGGGQVIRPSSSIAAMGMIITGVFTSLL